MVEKLPGTSSNNNNNMNREDSTQTEPPSPNNGWPMLCKNAPPSYLLHEWIFREFGQYNGNIWKVHPIHITPSTAQSVKSVGVAISVVRRIEQSTNKPRQRWMQQTRRKKERERGWLVVLLCYVELHNNCTRWEGRRERRFRMIPLFRVADPASN